MKVKTSELIGKQLDYAVAVACGYTVHHNTLLDGHLKEGWWIQGFYKQNANEWIPLWLFDPSTHWTLGGPIIQQEKIAVWWDGHWHSKYDGCSPDQVQDADHPLIAAMRCLVRSNFGDEVEIPDELVN